MRPPQCHMTSQAFHLLFIGDGIMAAVTHPHLKLEPHEWDGGALGGALPTHSLATLPAVVLGKQKTGKSPLWSWANSK